MEYIVDNSRFHFSYTEVREAYLIAISLDDEEFMRRLPEMIHLACVICYFKEIPTYVCLSDKGIIHELAHLMHIPEGNTTTLRQIRLLFEDQLKLS